jgi:hypothetical protein
MNKLHLHGIQAAPSSARPTHPTVQADGETQKLLDQWAIINPQFKNLKNQNETLAKLLAAPIKALFFGRYAGIEAESSTLLVLAGGRTVKLITKNSYSKMLTDDAKLIAAIGAELAGKYFKQATIIKLDLDKAPADKQEAFANGVIELAQKLGVTDAVSASQCIQPIVGFHESRTTLLTPDQNLALDRVLPITAYPQL